MNTQKIGGCWYDLDDLKRNTDLSALYGNGKVRCHWHDDSSPSCQVYPDHVYCFACGKAADAIEFVMAQEQLGWAEAVKFLVQHKGEKREVCTEVEEIPEDFLEYSAEALARDEAAQLYLMGRGLSRETWEALDVGVTASGISIPHFVNGKVVNVKFRNLNAVGPKYTSLPGRSFTHLYPFDYFHMNKPDYSYACITEGEFDAMVLLQAGFTAFSLPSGVNTDLWQWLAFLKRFKQVYLLFDQDAAGNKAIDKAFGEENVLHKTFAEALEPTQLFRVGWPAREGKDVTDAREYLLPKLRAYVIRV